jgi:putative ABC transport system permease protein
MRTYFELMGQDLRHAFRALLRRRSISAVSILTVALAVGASAAIFSIVSAILIQPPPYRDAARLVILWNVNDRLGYTYEDVTSRRGESMSASEFLEWKTNSGIFESMAGFEARTPTITGTDHPEPAHGYLLTEGSFSVIGIQTLLGRLPEPDEQRFGSAPVALLRHDFWLRRFHGDSDVIGRTIQFDGIDHRIIGVLPPGQMFFNRASDYLGVLPFNPRSLANPERGLRVMARLKTGMTVQEAQAGADRFSAEMASRHPATNSNWRVRVVSVKEDTAGKLQPAMVALLGAVAFVLLIMCANIANLLLVQGVERAREFAVKVALGAGRARVIRECLIESLLLSLSGGALGLALAVGIVAYFRLIRPDRFGNLRWLLQAESIGVDWRVVLFALATAVLTGVLFGLFPAFRASRPNLNEDLKASGRGSPGSARAKTAGKVLVVAEVALGLILVVGATLLVRSFVALYQSGPGFRSNGLLAFQVTLPVNEVIRDVRQQGLSGPEAGREIQFRIQGLNQRLLADLATIPGVRQAAATSSNLSIGSWFEPRPFSIEGRSYEPGRGTPMATADRVTPNFFSTMGIPLMRGRAFSSGDVPGGQPVTIVNDELARRYFPNEDPVGKRIKPGPPESPSPWLTIVGVVGSIRRSGMDKAATPAFYGNSAQTAGSLTLVLQTDRNPIALLPDARLVVRRVNPGIPSFEGRDMTTVVRDSAWQLNYSMILLGGLAALALVLTIVGVFGILSYSIRERTQEIGVRIALGASRRDVLLLILRQGVTLVAIGIGIGLVSAVGLTRFLSALLFGVKPLDWLAFGFSSVLLVAAGIVATYLPARRATRIEPIEALRHQ